MKDHHRQRYLIRGCALLFAPLYWFVIVLLGLGNQLQLVLAVTLYLALQGGFSYWHYRMSREVGLSKQNPREWLKDQLKRFALAALLWNGAALGLVVLITRVRLWWLAAALIAAAISVFFSYVSTVLLMPLFNRFTPLEDRSLADRLKRLARKARTRILEAYVMDMGRRTTAANAMLTGAFNTRHIILADTLLENFTAEEIETIMAHELGHHYYHHIPKALLLGGIGTLLSLYTASLLVTFEKPIAAIPRIFLLLSLLAIPGQIIANTISRYFEVQCDRFAVRLSGNPAAFSSALSKLGHQNQSDFNPPALVKYLFFSHPPISERLELIRHPSKQQKEAD